MKYACLLAILIVAACAPTVDDVAESPDTPVEQPAVDPNEQCDAADYRPLIGSQVTATTFETGKLLRVYSENDIVTQEYIPQRTNVIYNTGGAIVQVTCG